jgi:threonine/homoserine/homoserine lactone efflux protein
MDKGFWSMGGSAPCGGNGALCGGGPHPVMVTFLTIGIVYAFTAVAQPGSYQTFVVSQALASGWRRTWPAAFSPILSDIPIAGLVLFILVQVPKVFVSWLQIGGGLFLLYLAFGSFMAWRRFDPAEKPPVHSGARSLLKAALINLLNPNPYIGWSLVMGPLAVKAWHEAPACAFALLVGFYGTMVTGMMIIIVAASALGGIGAKVRRLLLGVSSFALACFGLFELWLGGRGLLG